MRVSERIRVFYQVSKRPLYTVSDGHFVSELITLCGGDNVFADLGELAPGIDVEAVIDRDPEVMLAATDAGADAFSEWGPMAQRGFRVATGNRFFGARRRNQPADTEGADGGLPQFATHCSPRASNEPVSGTRMTHDVLIRPGSAADFDVAVALLSRANLPVCRPGVPASVDRFLVATVEQSIAGLIGLECYESIGLLRSLVVDSEFRGAGLGRLLVAELEEQATGQGVREMWLLTIDADTWFQGLGLRNHGPRDQAPAGDRTDCGICQSVPGRRRC